MTFNQDGTINSLNGEPIKSTELFIYLGSQIANTLKDVELRIAKSWSYIGAIIQQSNNFMGNYLQYPQQYVNPDCDSPGIAGEQRTNLPVKLFYGTQPMVKLILVAPVLPT